METVSGDTLSWQSGLCPADVVPKVCVCHVSQDLTFPGCHLTVGTVSSGYLSLYEKLWLCWPDDAGVEFAQEQKEQLLWLDTQNVTPGWPKGHPSFLRHPIPSPAVARVALHLNSSTASSQCLWFSSTVRAPVKGVYQSSDLFHIKKSRAQNGHEQHMEDHPVLAKLWSKQKCYLPALSNESMCNTSSKWGFKCSSSHILKNKKCDWLE